jgi:hypothetical protein
MVFSHRKAKGEQNMNCITKFLLRVTVCLTLTSCATAHLPNQGNLTAPVEMQTYRINITDKHAWKDWEASQKTENDALVLTRLRKWPLTGEVQGVVTMMVVRDTIAPECWGLAEAQHADAVRALEEKIMREQGPAKGKYEIQELTNGDLMRDGKKLYSMTWTASQSRADLRGGKRMIYLKGAMYLYFPEAYKDTHAFYRFVITDAVIPPTLFNPDTEQIYPIIDGFSTR